MNFRTSSLWLAVTIQMIVVAGCQFNSRITSSGTAASTQTSGVPVLSLSPANLTFASTPVNAASATQAITLTNTGSEALSLSGTGLGISISGANAGSFSQTNMCGTSVAAGVSCAITVTFSPAASGTLNAALSIADNASGSPATVALSGTGSTPVVTLSSPASLTFASTTVGTTAEAQTITLFNTGNGALILSGTGLGITINGANANSYSQTNTCGASVAAGGSCAITVTFSPAASGTLNAAVSIAANADEITQTVPLSGTGSAAVASSSAGSGNIYYVDNTIADINIASATPDCTTYNPTTYVCGTGSANAFATVADISSK
ncbi:MAG: choice-of-anchor D domain-containing protein, partial [Terracidiphilus sp.]